MKNKKQKMYQGMFIGAILIIILTITCLGINTLLTKIETKSAYAGIKTNEFFNYQDLTQTNLVSIPVKTEKEYAYNEQVPEEVILNEMKVLSERFGLIYSNWEELVRCESTCDEYNYKRHNCIKGEIDNKAENPNSTAVGAGQYLINTWYATESWKQYSKARTDYKATLWEMALDLANGEESKWIECLEITGIYNYIK